MRALRWLALCVAAFPAAAFAHKPSDAYLNLQVNGAVVEQRLDIALRDLDRDLALDANDDGRLQWGEVRARWADIEQLVTQSVQLTVDGKPCQPSGIGTPLLDEHSDGRYAVTARRWNCPQPVAQLGIAYRLFAATDPSHRGIVRLRGDTGQDHSAVVTPDGATQRFALGATGSSSGAESRSFFAFLAEGVHHILIGIDHVLFLLALLLPALVRRAPGAVTPSGRSTMQWLPAPALRPVLFDVLRIVTAFTVAHSITLALAAFDVLNPPSRWIESIIAASVVLAALNNLVPVFGEGRWRLTFLFGLVHGFGFAGALKDLGLQQGALAVPLLGFNIGVELGQLAIVALFLLLTWRWRGTRFYRQGLLGVGSVLIALLALVWLLERAFDLQWGV